MFLRTWLHFPGHRVCDEGLPTLRQARMKLPSPRQTLAGCVWLPRIIAKARQAKRGTLDPEYAARFCHPTGVDGLFVDFFRLTKEDLLEVCEASDESVAAWFVSPDSAGGRRIQEWNHLAVNLGRAGFPMADRLPIALATAYQHLGGQNLQTVFEVLEADEEDAK